MDLLGVFLDKGAQSPLYEQLYRHLVGRIRAGELPAGERLPGKRSAAAQLGVSVNTVDEAYQMLAAEGYVVAKPRSGFVVDRLEQLVPPPAAEEEAERPGPEGLVLLKDPAAEKQPWKYDLSSSGLDTSLFPRKTWNRLFREVLADQPDLFDRGEAAGDEVLRKAIVGYVGGYRGVRCEPGQVVVGAGLELLCSMLVRLFPERGVAVESPGYPKTAKILHNEGVAVVPVAVDGHGMRPDLLAASGAGVAYLTPSHQFPTGAVMPVGRRTELLGWAAAGGLIIEDDYDSEFRFDGRPLPCLQGLDPGGNVVYAGTFSRSLAPGLRAAYLVLPRRLLRRWQAMYGDYACTMGRPEQHTLARMIGGGHFSRSLNRARGVYKQRRDSLMATLDEALAGVEAKRYATHTGLYFLLELPGRDAVAVAKKAREQGLRIRAVAEYRQELEAQAAGVHWNALIVGYGGLSEGVIQPAAEALAGVIKAF